MVNDSALYDKVQTAAHHIMAPTPFGQLQKLKLPTPFGQLQKLKLQTSNNS
jgi:hypothetical protein